MLKDTLNVWHAAGLYHVRYAGQYKTFCDYLNAKAYIDSVMESVWFMGGINDNKKNQRYFNQ